MSAGHGRDASWDEYDEIIGMLDALGLLGEPPAPVGGDPLPGVPVPGLPLPEPPLDHEDHEVDGQPLPGHHERVVEARLPDLAEPGELISASDIKRHRPGWTEAAIRRFLGPPDDVVTNPHRAAGPPMRMYTLTRVEVAEARPDFIAWRARAEERSASARRSSERARDAALRLADEWAPVLPELPPDELLVLALDDHNNRQMCLTDADEFVPLGADDDPGLVQEAVEAFLWRRSGAETLVYSVAPQHRRALREALRGRLRDVAAMCHRVPAPGPAIGCWPSRP